MAWAGRKRKTPGFPMLGRSFRYAQPAALATFEFSGKCHFVDVVL
jgi:hypothetical protein